MTSFSILTPVYNLASANRMDWMKQAMQSTSKQDHKDVEHIIIDGLSTDDTVERIKELIPLNKSAQIISKADKNLYEALNNGAAIATGEYLLFLGSDDFFHDNTLFSDLSEIAQKHAPDFIYGTINTMDEDGISKLTVKTSQRGFLRQMPFCAQGFAVKASLFEKLGGFNETYKISSDFDFIQRMYFGGARGHNANISIATIRLGGLAMQQDYRDELSAICQKNLSTLIGEDTGSLSNSIYRGWYPINLLVKVIKNAKNYNANLIRKAALHEMLRTLRRSIWKRRSNRLQ